MNLGASPTQLYTQSDSTCPSGKRCWQRSYYNYCTGNWDINNGCPAPYTEYYYWVIPDSQQGCAPKPYVINPMTFPSPQCSLP